METTQETTQTTTHTTPIRPESYLVWAILSTIFCCIPFGIVSIVYAAQVDGLWNSGDHEGARRAARNARTWFWWAFGTGIFSVIVYTVLFALGVLALGVAGAAAGMGAGMNAITY